MKNLDELNVIINHYNIILKYEKKKITKITF